ncbi:MAG: macro domain-containing protein [Anaerolineae bacterium]|nr:macro domain-containing protein [Anaerolineae bacterium]
MTNTVLKDHIFFEDHSVQLVQGDITQQRVDAIVNAANAQLLHGGGLAAIIARKGGRAIQQESRAWVQQHGPLTHAEPAYTSGGELPCRYVIHAVGPVWGSGDEDAKLAAAVHGALRLAERLELASIALPAISTGIFGFPKVRAAKIIYHTIGAYFAQNPQSTLALVRLTLFDQPTTDAFVQVWQQAFP